MTRTSSRRTSRAPLSRLTMWCTPGSGVRSESKKSGRRLSSWGAYRSYVTSSSGHRLTPVSGVWARQSRSTISGRRSRRTSPPCIVRKTAGCAALWSLLKSSYRTTGASSSRLTTRSTGAYAKSSAPSRKRCAPARLAGTHLCYRAYIAARRLLCPACSAPPALPRLLCPACSAPPALPRLLRSSGRPPFAEPIPGTRALGSLSQPKAGTDAPIHHARHDAACARTVGCPPHSRRAAAGREYVHDRHEHVPDAGGHKGRHLIPNGGEGAHPLRTRPRLLCIPFARSSVDDARDTADA